jgi:hypothetical protein
MSVKCKSNFDPKKTAKQILESQKKKLGIAMADATAEIEIRTLQGKAADGQSFKPYSPEYAEKKASKKVNLHVTGAMLGAMQHTVREIKNGILEGKISFAGHQVNKARWNNATRRFMALSKRQLQKLKQTMRLK